MNHIPFSKLADLAEGRMSAAERSESLAHISECSRCTAQTEKLEGVINLMRTDKAEDAPRDLVAHTINLWRTRAAVPKEPSLIQRIVAVLSFDSLQTSPAFAVRSGHAAARQLFYSAEGCDLDLRITQSGEMWNVAGQVFGKECAGGHVEIESASSVAKADLNDQCEFALAALPSGGYQLRLCLTDIEVEIPQLELRA
jgi:hypothetical protein